MFYGNNYENNTQNNYTNKYPNQNYLSQSFNNNLQSIYINNSNFSTNESFSNNYKLNNSYISNQTVPQRKKNANKKKVTFNQNVMVIKVQSYKEYNKLDDDINLENLLNSDANKQKINFNIDKKKGDRCECFII